MAIDIQRIGISEIGSIVFLFDQYRVFYGEASNEQLAHEYLSNRLRKKESIIYAAFDSRPGDINATGFVQIYRHFSSIRAITISQLNDLFVLPLYRNKGVGTMLVHQAIKSARKNQHSLVQLETGTENLLAQKLYESIGFTRRVSDKQFYNYFLNLQ